MLNGSRGTVLDLGLLGDAGSYEHGSITLGGGVRVSDLTVDDFLLVGGTDPAPGSAPRVATYDELAYQLADGYWAFSATEYGGYGTRRAFNVATGGTLTADITALTPEGQQLARWALEAWTNVTGIEFRFVSGGAHITFDDDEPGAFSQATELRFGGEIRKAHVNVSVDWLYEHGSTIDSHTFRAYLHETGHALGLGHPGDYNDVDDDYDLTYAVDAKFLNDSWQASLMSYWDQDQNTYVGASYALPVTPMIADIIAIQNLYGVPTGIHAGDTVYGYGSNVGGYLGQLFAALSGEERNPDLYAGGPVALTIHDTGGDDLLDLRFDTFDQRVDLRPEGISDVLGRTGNLSIARGTLIEKFWAGSGDDAVIGNSADNNLAGLLGDDTLVGGDGDDWLSGGSGADRLQGGAGQDWASYYWSDPGVRVNLGTGEAVGGEADGDTLYGIENLRGSAHDDELTGNDGGNELLGIDGNDTLSGGAGDDWLYGGAGADQLDGGAGDDGASYFESDAGVRVDLGNGAAAGGEADGDTFRGIEHLRGSAHDDTLTGSNASNYCWGGTATTLYAAAPGTTGSVGALATTCWRAAPVTIPSSSITNRAAKTLSVISLMRAPLPASKTTSSCLVASLSPRSDSRPPATMSLSPAATGPAPFISRWRTTSSTTRSATLARTTSSSHRIWHLGNRSARRHRDQESCVVGLRLAELATQVDGMTAPTRYLATGTSGERRHADEPEGHPGMIDDLYRNAGLHRLPVVAASMALSEARYNNAVYDGAGSRGRRHTTPSRAPTGAGLAYG